MEYPQFDQLKPVEVWRYGELPKSLLPQNEKAQRFARLCDSNTPATLVTNRETGYTVLCTGLYPVAVPWERDLWIHFMPQENTTLPYILASYDPSLRLG